jgi:hypothetical protein
MAPSTRGFVPYFTKEGVDMYPVRKFHTDGSATAEGDFRFSRWRLPPSWVPKLLTLDPIFAWRILISNRLQNFMQIDQLFWML